MSQKVTIFLLRISLGWYMFYAGITKILNPEWTAEGYVSNAKIFKGFYLWLASPEIMPVVNFINAWGLTLLGVSLILGIFVRYSAPLGALLMMLYYIPLGIIYPNNHSMFVDDHIIFALVLMYFFFSDAGKNWGLDKYIGKK